MPKVTVFANGAHATGDSLVIEDSRTAHSVYETTDVLFITQTAAECSTALGTLRELQSAVIQVIETIDAKRTQLLIDQLRTDPPVAEITLTEVPETFVVSHDPLGIFGTVVVDPDIANKRRGGE